MADQIGELRWVKAVTVDEWHLSFNGTQTLCEHGVDFREEQRSLSEGPPARHCKACGRVIAWRLGLATSA